MPTRSEQVRRQLDKVYTLMGLQGQPGDQQVVFGEGAIAQLLRFMEMLPEGKATELIYQLSTDTPAILVAGLINILVWSADGAEGIDLDELAEWFYSDNPRKIKIALQLDIFPSSSMQESQRILEKIQRKHPHLSPLVEELRTEVDHRLAEEESWAEYRRNTFEMPKEMTEPIMNIIRDIKRS